MAIFKRPDQNAGPEPVGDLTADEARRLRNAAYEEWEAEQLAVARAELPDILQTIRERAAGREWASKVVPKSKGTVAHQWLRRELESRGFTTSDLRYPIYASRYFVVEWHPQTD